MSESYNPFNNPAFRAELSELFDEKLHPVVTELDAQKMLVAAHERERQQRKGMALVLAGLWSLLVVGVEYLFHRRAG